MDEKEVSILFCCISCVDRGTSNGICSRKSFKNHPNTPKTIPSSSAKINDWKRYFITMQSSSLPMCTNLWCSLYEALLCSKTPLYHTFLLKKKKNVAWKLKVKYLCLKLTKLLDTSAFVLHILVCYLNTSSKLISAFFTQIFGRK